MATESKRKLLTADEFLQMDLGEGTHELVRGEIVEMPPAGGVHGRVCINAGFILESFGRQAGHGYVLGNDTAVITERGPDSVRGADVCYYSRARLPREDLPPGAPPIPPDLIIEVYSPSDRPGPMRTKVNDYLNAGVPMVWVLYPTRRSITLYRADDPEPLVLGPEDVIEDLPELPGFRCPVAEFFA